MQAERALTSGAQPGCRMRCQFSGPTVVCGSSISIGDTQLIAMPKLPVRAVSIVVITDSFGIGIPEAELLSVSDKFEQCMSQPPPEMAEPTWGWRFHDEIAARPTVAGKYLRPITLLVARQLTVVPPRSQARD